MADEVPFRAAHELMSTPGFTFGLDLDRAASWSDHLQKLEAQRRGQDLPADRVPATFLVAEVDGELVGRLSVRHQLNEWLAQQGGHIGYGVLPEHRGRGHATEMLRRGIVIARAVGVGRILLVCDHDNEASARVIERCGGVFESILEHTDDGVPLRRYWID